MQKTVCAVVLVMLVLSVCNRKTEVKKETRTETKPGLNIDQETWTLLQNCTVEETITAQTYGTDFLLDYRISVEGKSAVFAQLYLTEMSGQLMVITLALPFDNKRVSFMRQSESDPPVIVKHINGVKHFFLSDDQRITKLFRLGEAYVRQQGRVPVEQKRALLIDGCMFIPEEWYYPLIPTPAGTPQSQPSPLHKL